MSNMEMVEKLDSGWRLPPPASCPSYIIDLMNACWQQEPQSRPTMKQILSKLIMDDDISEPVRNNRRVSSQRPKSSVLYNY